MNRPQTQYVKTDEGYVAYQVFGEGQPDILFVTNWSTNLEVMWEEPSLARYFERLASFGRVICFDKRGTGVSDPVPLSALPTLEEWMDDARVVMDAVDSRYAAIIGDTEGGVMAILFAATYPERASSLVLVNAFARMLRDEDYPIGIPLSSMDKLANRFEESWGTSIMLEVTAPSMARDERFVEWFTRYQRLAMPPGAAATMFRWVLRVDVRSVLPSIAAPTLVIHRADNAYYRPTFGRYLAQSISGAEYVEIPGTDAYPFHGEGSEQVIEEIQAFLTGARTPPQPDRVLATILFTDIVDSTERAVQVGDTRWRDLLETHDKVSRQLIAQFRGRVIRSTGDGILAIFDGPARAIRCAKLIVDAISDLGLELRSGLHTGEVELQGEEIGGIAVHIAARVMAAASGREVLVSRTVKDLVVGSGINFGDRGEHALKGVPGTWQLFSLVQ
jgi:class 3 adenylate cyclase/pimeloyl-ACP methyl ester carboxylesterase